MSAPASVPASGRAARPAPPPLQRWDGQVPRFSRFREGGPGRPASLAVLSGIGVLLIVMGQRSIEADGISGGGPAMLLFGIVVLGFVALWLLIKAGLRSRDVTFVVDAKGVAIQPSARQRRLDKRLFRLSLLLFWMTWKSAVWSAWAPVTRWKEVRSIAYDDGAREILVRGGAWDIRLVCTEGNYAAVRAAVEAWWSNA